MPTFTPNYNLNKPLVNSATDEDLWGDQTNDNWDVMDTQLKVNADAAAAASGAPIGCPIPYFGSSAPTNHLLCYGQTMGNISSGADVTGSEYETLFNVVKECSPNTGSESFAGNDTVVIPDLRGRVIAGYDSMGGVSADRLTGLSGGVDGDTLGASGGVETHTLTTSEIPAHTHQQRYYGNTGGTPPFGASLSNNATNAADMGPITGPTGGDGAHNNVQPTTILNMIVRYQ